MSTHRHDKARSAAAADSAAMPIVGGLMALTALAALALMPGAAWGADPPNSAKEKPVKLEAVAGTALKRVTLTAKAAERLGIKTGTVGEATVPHLRMMGGLVLPVPPTATPVAMDAAGSRPAPTPAVVALQYERVDGKVWVSVPMSAGEMNSLALDRPARVMSLARDGADSGLLAMPSNLPPVVDPKRSMLTLHYIVTDPDRRLAHLQRVLVELKMLDHGARHIVVPTSAVLHDAKGAAWVYVNPAPLTYQREPIGIKRIAGDLTLLSSGPPAGAPIVTVGAPMLYGTEVYGK